jgi:hypothetical protein
MSTKVTLPPLTESEALAACSDVQQRLHGKPWLAGWWQCWGCRRFGGTSPEKMCIGAQPGYRGCQLVNRRLAGTDRP